MYKDNTNLELKKVYHQYGIEVALKVAKASMKSKEYKSDKLFAASLHGELCETILELKIMDFISKNEKECSKWVIGKGLILNDKTNIESEFLTEIDLILCTPRMLLIFECKGYRGEKTLLDTCTLVTQDGKRLDVYSQNMVHLSALETHFEKFRTLTPGKAIQLAFFEFSAGSVKDNRNKVSKSVMLNCNVNNIDKLLKSLAESKGLPRWDMRYVKKAVEIIEKGSVKLRTKHIEYVRSLHGKAKK